MIEPNYHLNAMLQAAAGHATENYARRSFWAVVLGLTPFLDGDAYCFLWGADLQSGVAGFGSTVLEAMADFDKSMNAQAPARKGK